MTRGDPLYRNPNRSIKLNAMTTAEITGKTVRATYSEDASLLGGVLVRVGSTIYDGSVLGRLQRMRAEIAGNW